MRELTNHKSSPVKISVLDEPGAGGASYYYMVTLPDWSRAPDGSSAFGVWDIQFQNGEADVNGLTEEVLLAIVADRLQSFQAGPHACDENEMTLVAVESAMRILHSRTLCFGFVLDVNNTRDNQKSQVLNGQNLPRTGQIMENDGPKTISVPQVNAILTLPKTRATPLPLAVKFLSSA